MSDKQTNQRGRAGCILQKTGLFVLVMPSKLLGPLTLAVIVMATAPAGSAVTNSPSVQSERSTPKQASVAQLRAFILGDCSTVFFSGVRAAEYRFSAGGKYNVFGAVLPTSSGVWRLDGNQLCFAAEESNFQCWRAVLDGRLRTLTGSGVNNAPPLKITHCKEEDR
jgi:hypothetical protein